MKNTFIKTIAACAAVGIFSTGAYTTWTGVSSLLDQKIKAVNLAASPIVIDGAVLDSKGK